MEKEGKAEQIHVEAIGNVTYWSVTVGSQDGTIPNDLIFKITGLNLGTSTPFCVVFQSRQTENKNNGWSDKFAIQVIDTSKDFIRVSIRRMDRPYEGQGWGQQLGLNFIVQE
jgi:hypothetical protein